MSNSLNYHADIERGNLPELLYKLYRHRVPGMVEARRGDVVKRLFVKDGNVLYATSSDRNDSLGRFLVRRRLITEDDLQAVSRASGRKRFGVLLMECGLLSPLMLNAAIRQQVEEVAWSLFSWDQGELDVNIGQVDNGNAIEIHIPMRSMILRGVRRMGDPKPLIERMGGRSTVLEITSEEDALIDIGVDEKEYALFQKVDGELTVYDLCGLGILPPSDSVKVLFAFWVLHLVREKSEAGVKIRLSADGGL